MAFLGFELEFSQLFTPSGLRQVQAAFETELARSDASLYAQYKDYLAFTKPMGAPDESALLLKLAPHVGHFVGERFGVLAELAALRDKTHAEDRRFRFKREIVTRRVRMKRKASDFQDDPQALFAALPVDTTDERAVAELALNLWDVFLPMSQLQPGEAHSPELAARLAALAVADPSALFEQVERAVAYRLWHPVHRRSEWISALAPKDVDFDHLVHIERLDPSLPEAISLAPNHWRQRPGFKLTDTRAPLLEVLDQVHYCIYCHPREKDSCSKGFKQKDATFKKNALGVALEGCPLEEKISEAHVLRKEGDSVSSLAMIMVDNPMCPGTGHRICNDCMKGCIYQKQSPVNIPMVETHVLTEVLGLPYGVEIYGLLARWNPLNRKRPVALDHNGKNVLVVGLGPAGYTLAHYLSREGFGVVAVDGAKLEPLPEAWVNSPIRDYQTLAQNLDERSVLGFGGVSEYGITVRWDKNFLTLMYLTLMRAPTLKMIGGVRFGGTLDLDDAWLMGFDHVAIAAGAGKPTMIDVKNNVARGVRQASDFLMALQLSGAFKKDSLSNLQVRLPAIVIGGGLTAIDTATELLSYYVVQVERMLERHDAIGEDKCFALYDAEELAVYKEMIGHARLLREERAKAAPQIAKLVNTFGGVKIVYRKTLKDSPAYRLNHEEIEKGLEEGIQIVECLSPIETVVDQYGAVEAMVFERFAQSEGKFASTGEHVRLPARTVCVAAGTSPNTMYEKEYVGSFAMDRQYFKNHSAKHMPDGTIALDTADGWGFFTSYLKNGRTVTYYGDNHPRYAGSVVKAMASAKDGYPHVVALFAGLHLDPAQQGERDAAWKSFVSSVEDSLMPKVVRIERLTPTIVDVVVRAPLQAKKFQPGQFYRLQNYEVNARRALGVPLVMEGLALTGAGTDPDKGLLSMIVLEMGASSRLCASLREGESVVVMGPTGTPTEIPRNENVVLVGGGLGNAVLFSIAAALKKNGCKVLYFAGYKKGEDLYRQEEIERSCDQVVWCTDSGVEIAPRRPQDTHVRGNIVQAMVALGKGELGKPCFSLQAARRFIVIGSDRMMAAVARARHEALRPCLSEDHVAIGSINSPMQCMMKEICAQCLQRHVDPATGKESFVFSCYNQDQLLDQVDWKHLNERLRQNTVQEKQTNLWLDHLLAS